MSIEQALAENTAALNKQNTLLEKLLAAGGVSGGASASTSSGETKTTAKTVTVEEMQAALTEVKEKYDSATAKAIIKKAGGVEKMAEIPKTKIKAVFEACQAKLAEATGTAAEEGDGL